MEEDIKILEKLIKEFDEFEKRQHINIYMLTKREKQAIEHLIARNKELTDKGIELATNIDALETDLKELKEKNKELESELYCANNIISDQIDLLRDSIPKSKVRDKIEEKIEYLKQIIDNGANGVRFANSKEEEIERTERQKNISTMIDILQQILETLELLEN